MEKLTQLPIFDDMEQLLSQLISNYNFNLILSINIISYLIIQLLHKIMFTPKGIKILITIIVSIAMAILYHFISDISTEVLINSAILAPLAWDWVFKPVLNKIGIDYKEDC